MKRFYIILAGLFLMALAWELVGQSRQTVYDARWSIGTNSPEATAHVHGNVLIVRTANGESPSLTIRSTTTEGSPAVPAFIMWQPINNTTNVSITTHGEMLLANSLAIGTNSSPLLGVGVGLQLFQGNALFAGNVGIGTNGPVGRLDVVQGTAAGAAIMLYDTNGAIRGRISTLPGASDYFAMWFGTNAVAPTAQNYTIGGNGGATLLNSSGSTFALNLLQGNSAKWGLDGNGSWVGNANLARDIGTGAIMTRTNYSGWNTRINENILTNTVTAAATLYVNLGTNQVQFLQLAGDSTIHTTNRATGVGFRGTTVFVQGAATNCVLTLNTNWINFGTNNTVTALANKAMVFTFGLKGTAESDVYCSYDSQKN